MIVPRDVMGPYLEKLGPEFTRFSGGQGTFLSPELFLMSERVNVHENVCEHVYGDVL